MSTVEPTFSIVPDGDDAAGQDAIDLAKSYGIPLDEWQESIVKGILRENNGNWCVSQAGLCVARQSGKGQILLALELAGLLLFKEQVLHTAHAVKTSSDAFRRLWAVIQGYDDLSKMVRRHSQMIGAEYVELSNGARIAFTTRSASSGRGLSIDRLVVDEAEDLPASEISALAPTVFSRPRAQSLYFGTAPGPFHDSEAFETLRKAAHGGLNSRLAWWEWCAEYGADIDDRDLLVRLNPAVATGRVPYQAIVDDRAVLPVDSFKAERMSMWLPAAGGSTVFDADTWQALCDVDSAPAKKVCVGIDAPPSREHATVCVAGVRGDGLAHVEWYSTHDGVQWLPMWVAARLNMTIRAVVVDERSPLIDLDWAGAGVRLTTVGAREVAVAAGGLYDAVTEQKLRHRGQVELTQGVLGAKQRPMMAGQGFGWERRAPGSTTLIAASLALHGVTAVRVRKPARPEPGADERRGLILT